jgi:hypothetical protein
MAELQSAQSKSIFCNTASRLAAYTALLLASSASYSHSVLEVVHSEKAYDNIHRPEICKALHKANISKELMEIIKNIYGYT